MSQSFPKILIIEDEESVRKAVEFTLNKHYEVFGAPTLEDGIDVLECQDISCVIMDLVFQGDNIGSEIFHSIRDRSKNIPIVILSAYAEFEMARTAINRGVSAYVMKPFDTVEFLELINHLVASYQKVKEVNVLYIDGRKDGVVMECLEGCGMKVHIADNAIEAMMEVAMNDYDFVLSVSDLPVYAPELLVDFLKNEKIPFAILADTEEKKDELSGKVPVFGRDIVETRLPDRVLNMIALN
jgi:DNA-binding NtrC family response regulator